MPKSAFQKLQLNLHAPQRNLSDQDAQTTCMEGGATRRIHIGGGFSALLGEKNTLLQHRQGFPVKVGSQPRRARLTLEHGSESIPKASAQTPGHRGPWIYGTAPHETADVGECAHLHLYSRGAGCQSGLIRDKFTRAHSVTPGTSLLACHRPAERIGRLPHMKATGACMLKMNFTGRHRDSKRRRACVTNDIQM